MVWDRGPLRMDEGGAGAARHRHDAQDDGRGASSISTASSSRVIDDEIWFKADAESAPIWEAEGCERFAITLKDGSVEHDELPPRAERRL